MTSSFFLRTLIMRFWAHCKADVILRRSPLLHLSKIKFFAIFRAQNKNIKQNFVEKKELSLNRRIFRSSNLAQTYFYRPRRGISVPLLKITPSPPTLHTSYFVPLCPLTTFIYRVCFKNILIFISNCFHLL